MEKSPLQRGRPQRRDDLTSRPDAGANFVNGAAYELIRQGDVLFTDFTRVYQGARSIHGVTIVVDRPDGKRVRTSLSPTRDGSISPRRSCCRRAATRT